TGGDRVGDLPEARAPLGRPARLPGLVGPKPLAPSRPEGEDAGLCAFPSLLALEPHRLGVHLVALRAVVDVLGDLLPLGELQLAVEEGRDGFEGRVSVQSGILQRFAFESCTGKCLWRLHIGRTKANSSRFPDRFIRFPRFPRFTARPPRRIRPPGAPPPPPPPKCP